MFQTWHLYVSMSIEQAANNLEHNLYHKSILSHESLGDYTNICFYNRENWVYLLSLMPTLMKVS